MRARDLFGAVVLALTGGAVQAQAAESAPMTTDRDVSGLQVSDPWEGMNRGLYAVHDAIDTAVLEPVALGYRYVVPSPARTGVRNLLRNLNSPVVFANDVLQGSPSKAGVTLARFGVNTDWADHLRTVVAMSLRTLVWTAIAVVALLARRRELETRLAAKLSRLGRLGAEDPARPLLEQSERELVAELDPLEAALAESARGANNAPQSLAPARALSAPEAQALLDPETAVLFYALGADESFLWWLTPTRLEAFPLGPRQAFEPLARELAEQLARLDPGDRAAQSELARALAERLLAPLGTRLRTARHLAIVADGALGYLPFAVLPEPGDGTLLSARHELSYLPSLSALAAARSRPRSGELAQGTIAVVADPVLRADDPRLPSAARRSAGSVADPSPLPASRLEAEAILSLARKGQARALLGFDAARSRVIGGELAGQRILHFATHGVIDAAEPARSGLLLSAWNAAGEPQESFLGLRDVYGLKLGAELVVLSGCRTALGRELRGEGLVGLARGFLYAGTPRVIASLWPVEDQATAALMAHFYRALWQDGLPPAAALARAQSALAADRRWRDPFFWAGFVLEGEWR